MEAGTSFASFTMAQVEEDLRREPRKIFVKSEDEFDVSAAIRKEVLALETAELVGIINDGDKKWLRTRTEESGQCRNQAGISILRDFIFIF